MISYLQLMLWNNTIAKKATKTRRIPETTAEIKQRNSIFRIRTDWTGLSLFNFIAYPPHSLYVFWMLCAVTHLFSEVTNVYHNGVVAV